MALAASDRFSFTASIVARTAAWLALGAPTLWSQNPTALFTLAAIGLVWATAAAIRVRNRLSVTTALCLESALAGIIAGAAVHSAPFAIGVIAVAPFIGGLRKGLAGITTALVIQIACYLPVLIAVGGNITAQDCYSLLSWSIVGTGMGLVGSFISTVLRERENDLAPYRYAQGLLRRLISVSEGLDKGLNPVTLAGQLLWTVENRIPCASTAIFVPERDVLVPLLTKADAGTTSELEEIAEQAWELGAPVRRHPLVAVPLYAGSTITAVVAADLAEGHGTATLTSDHQLAGLARELYPATIQLDAALLFAAFRDAASAEERRRLAREMHDGMAQDIASLGYLVDAIASDAVNPLQRERIDLLRTRISAIVTEVRRTLVNLRTEIGESESLGAAIASIARNLANTSGVAIHVTTDETTDRLRHEVEAELFRIVQEAMNNALKHAHATEITVHCQVRAPAVLITVSDNGRGMGPAGESSHGLMIMKERANLIDAQLQISASPRGGVRVSVEIAEVGDLGSPPAASTPPQTSEMRVTS